MSVEENILSILERRKVHKLLQSRGSLAEFGIEHIRYAPSLSLSGEKKKIRNS